MWSLIRKNNHYEEFCIYKTHQHCTSPENTNRTWRWKKETKAGVPNSVNCTMWEDSSIIPIQLRFGTFWLCGQIHELSRIVRGNWLFTQTGRTCIITTGVLHFALLASHAVAGCAVLTSTSARTSRKRLECLLNLSLSLNFKRSKRKWKFKFN